ncbi:hypothetical protein BGX34_006753 [Mortierella sp. NVP85]|nr:hypothetical protein BGX34_006753 [Mortierella sp. NVP85]
MTTQPAKCSKLKIRIFFDSTIFQAGGNLFGRMEITATSSRSLKLGEIAVELAAYEEITSKEFTATQSFLSSRLSFQGPNIPPSNAVHGPCDENGFWMAKKGKTTFPFAFQLPLDCPSSLVFGQTASLRYVVTGLVQVFYHGKDETILKSKEAFVVEAWDGYNPDYKLPVRASNSTKLFWGGGGSIVLEALLSEKLHTAGGNLTVEVKVKNNTSRKVQGIRLGVHRRLEMVSNKDKAQQNPGLKIDTVSISEVVGTQEFKSSSYLFDTGEERTMTVNMIVPGNARAIRGTALFEVSCFVVVSVLLGAFSGELSVEIPVKICHPASLTPAPKPTLDDNHLPHHYNLVDEDMDLDPDLPTRSNRRVASNDSIAAPITSGYDSGNHNNQRDLPWGTDESDKQGEFTGIGRQGEWSQDPKGLSPANSITSIRSLLSSPKQKLSKLADKIQRSTSPSSSGHIQHEHRHGSKHLDDPNGQGRRLIPKSPPLGPAMPIAYVPAVERVRYTPFQAPPTTKAKEFMKAAAQYQQEMASELSGLGDDNVEFDLSNNRMASAIHQWISKKETEQQWKSQGVNRSSSPARSVSPIQIPNRRRPAVGRIDTQVGSFTSQFSATSMSPQSYDSPTSFGGSGQFPPSPGAADQTTSRFLHHAHRQPAAPQTEAYGSAPEDCMTDPPLFAKPLPLPSSPPTESPLQAAGMKASRARSLSPVPIPMQTPESLALAKQAFERVKRIQSPARDNMMNAAVNSASHSTTRPGSEDPPKLSNRDIKLPIPPQTPSSPEFGPSPSGLSRLLSNGVDTTQHSKPPCDMPNISLPSQPSSGPELRHIPMNRPLPVPAPKPRHLNLNNGSPGAPVGPLSGSRDLGGRSRPEPIAQPVSIAATSTSSGHLRNPQPVLATSSSLPRQEPPMARASGHLPEGKRSGTTQQNTYVPKPTPVPSTRPPPPIHHRDPNSGAALPNKMKPSLPVKGSGIKSDIKAVGRNLASSPTATATSGNSGGPGGSGFVYPKAARKPVGGIKPAVAAKPKNLAAQSTSGQVASRSPPRLKNGDNSPNGASVTSAVVNSQSPVETGQRSRQYNQGISPGDGAQSLEKPLTSVMSMRAPQVSMEPQQQQLGQGTQVVVGFETQRDVVAKVTEQGAEHGIEDDKTGKGDAYLQESDHVLQESGHDIRALPIAAAHSFRATGAHTGGYVVNTGKLRQVIKDNDASNQSGGSGGGSSSQLIQALAGGAMNAANAAVSGLGWRQQPPTSTTDRGQGVQQGIGGREKITHQVHDLTMKDVHFQTLSVSDQQVIAIDTHRPHHPRELEGTRSHHLVTSTQFESAAVQQKQSRSQPGSRVIDSSIRQEPLPAMPIVLAVEAVPTPSMPTDTQVITSVDSMAGREITPSSSSSSSSSTAPLTAAPNLDKTLPKIQEQTPRSRVFERPAEKMKNGDPAPIKNEGSKPIAVFADTSSATATANRIHSKPLPRPRYGQGTAAGSGPGSGSGVGATGNAALNVSAAAPKAINPKLQEYIQKYNLAASTRP